MPNRLFCEKGFAHWQYIGCRYRGVKMMQEVVLLSIQSLNIVDYPYLESLETHH